MQFPLLPMDWLYSGKKCSKRTALQALRPALLSEGNQWIRSVLAQQTLKLLALFHLVAQEKGQQPQDMATQPSRCLELGGRNTHAQTHISSVVPCPRLD